MTISRLLTRGLAVAALVVVLDQLSKWWILERIMLPPRVIEITSFFNLVLTWNRGVSFGMFNTDSPLNVWVLPLVAVAIVVMLVAWLARADRQLLAIALGSIIGGAIGNLIDRVRFGAVADFLDAHAFGYHWPAFNVADFGNHHRRGGADIRLRVRHRGTPQERIETGRGNRQMKKGTKGLALAAALLLVGGCQGIKEDLGIGVKRPPDEFTTYSRAPLSMPPDFALRPPANGSSTAASSGGGAAGNRATGDGGDGTRVIRRREQLRKRIVTRPAGTPATHRRHVGAVRHPRAAQSGNDHPRRGGPELRRAADVLVEHTGARDGRRREPGKPAHPGEPGAQQTADGRRDADNPAQAEGAAGRDL